jgi:hypothetical protein
MVRAKIHLSKKLERLKFIKKQRKSRLNILKLKERKEEFQLELTNRFTGLKVEELDIDTRTALISSTVTEVAEEIAPKVKSRRQKSKEDVEIEDLDMERKRLREIIDKTTTQKTEYKEIVKTVRKKRRQRSRRKRREQIETILESGKGPKQINKMNSTKTRITKLKKTDGSITSNREEMLDVCAEFYQDLYNSTHPQQNRPVTISSDQSEIPNISTDEVQRAIKQMKDNKAPGIDDLSSDVYKAGGAEIIKQLTGLYNQILEEKKLPNTWKEAKIILLHKKGEKTDIKNYRPISLLSHAYKIFTRIIQNRIKRILDENQPREQAGFREGYSTTDHLQALNQLIEKANEYQLKLCIGYIDYEKAFDSVEHSDLFAALRKIGVNEGYVKIIEDIYTNATATIYIDNDASQPIQINRGVRQGDTLSPKIFTAAVEEEVFKKLDLEVRGVNIDGERLTDLRFADDVALVTTSVEDMEIQLNLLNQESKKIGLKIHKGKTKYMTNFDTNETLEIENDMIEKVDSYKYLGKTVKMKDNTREEVLLRTKAGWSCFGRYRDILCDKKIPLSLRSRMYNQCVLPTMTYGAEAWSTTKETEQMLITTQRAMERQMLHISLRDKIRHSEIRKKTKVKDILEKIKEAKWRWAGHVARRQDNRWTKRITEWQPRTGKRRRGRQKRRWRDDITSYLGSTWTRQAQDRDRWKLLEEGYIQQWMQKPR